MRVAYYPWNLRRLVSWLDAERPGYTSPVLFSESLGIPLKTLQLWTIDQSPAINLQDLNALAKYRRTSLQQVVEWLEISPIHLAALQQNTNGQ